MNFTTLENVLWASGFIGNLALLAVLLFKNRAKSFPVFACWTLYQVIETATLFQIGKSGSAHAYFLAYWSFAAGDYFGQIAVILEIARDVLRPTGSWIVDARKDFILWSAISALVAGGLAVAMSPAGKSGLVLWSTRSSLFTSLLTCEVYLAMATAANRLGLQWRNHVMTLGEGLTFWATIALIVDVIRYGTTLHSYSRELGIIRSAAYVLTTIFWSITFALPERRREPISDDMMQYLFTLHQQVRHDIGIVEQEGRPRS